MNNTMQWNAERYVHEAGFVPQLAQDLIEVLVPRAGERILDLGCGDGQLTALLAARGARVLGVDSSPSQVAMARTRGLEVLLLDATALPFASEFDAVFSNAALHWMKDAAAVAHGMARSLRPGGRLVAELGGAGNVGALREALHAALERRGVDAGACDPWYFPTPAQYATVLETAGLRLRDLHYFSRPTAYTRDIGDWLTLMAVPLLAAVPETGREAVIDEVRAALAPRLLDAQGVWQLDYVRLRVTAEKPA